MVCESQGSGRRFYSQKDYFFSAKCKKVVCSYHSDFLIIRICVIIHGERTFCRVIIWCNFVFLEFFSTRTHNAQSQKSTECVYIYPTTQRTKVSINFFSHLFNNKFPNFFSRVEPKNPLPSPGTWTGINVFFTKYDDEHLRLLPQARRRASISSSPSEKAHINVFFLKYEDGHLHLPPQVRRYTSSSFSSSPKTKHFPLL